MAYKRCIIFLCLCFFISVSSIAQTVSCPTNLGFESGNFSNWVLYTGTCCPIATPGAPSGPVTTRHTITSGTDTDYYGGFPIVAPGGGLYSLKLGNDHVAAQAERARYFVRVPAGVNNYSVIFRYAVVFEDPGHPIAEQPRFEIKAYDSITKATINCSQFTYVATSSLPGFLLSPKSAALLSDIYYKTWTTASLNLTGFAGRTVVLDFASGDCDQGGHFGYGYVDMNCGLFQIAYNACDTSSTVSLSAPPGFASYSWRDSSTWATVGSGQSVTIARPATTKTYAVILTPYSGFGCADTLYTRVTVNNLTVNATNDTVVCGGSGTGIQLNAGATATATPLIYSWTPTTGLSCSTCANPIATPTTNRRYTVTVTDANGCSRKDSVMLTLSNPTVSVTPQQVSCNNAANGSLTATPSGGYAPYTYSWNTIPVRTTSTITALPVGTYILTVTDSLGCTKKDTSIITQPSVLVATTSATTRPACHGGTNGSATVAVSGGTANYTYSWNTVPVQTSATATGLAAGNYIVTVTDSKGCSDTALAVITQPTVVAAAITSTTQVACNGSSTGVAVATASGGTSPYSYSWNTSPVQTTATATGLAAGVHIVTVTDNNGCTDTAIATISQSTSLVASITGSTNVNCNGGTNGTAAATAAGGTSPYTYSWNTSPSPTTTASVTGLAAGTYTVTVRDAGGCSSFATVSITQPTAVNASVYNPTNVSCAGSNNGAATVTVTGGTPGYTYSWNTTPAQTTATATGLKAGDYYVTVTDSKGCTDTALAQIAQPLALNATIGGTTNVSCHGGNNGTASVSVSGGTPTYTFSWNTTPAQTGVTATSLTPGNYIVTVTDSKGCSDTALAIIAQPIALDASITSVTSISCYGGSNGTATAGATGGTAAYTYSWNTTPVQTTATATGLSLGSYLVTVTDNKGCTDTAIANITQPAQMEASLAGVDRPSCNGSRNGSMSVSVTGGTPVYSYSWNTTPVQTTATATGLAIGSYTVTVTDSKGCVDTMRATVTQPTVLVATMGAVTNTTCIGNIGTAKVNVTGGTPGYTYNWNTTPSQISDTAKGLAAGSYIVTVTDSKGCTDTALAIISQPSALTAAISSTTNVGCNGGSNGAASVSVTGGTSGYTYSWNTTPVRTTSTITGLAAGNYIVTVTDSTGCSDTALSVISQPAVLVASMSLPTNINCNGGSNGGATAVVTGGTPGYSYSWNTTPVQTTPSATGLGVGTHIVTVTDSKGCSDTAMVVISQPPTVNATITASTNVTCNGGNNGSATVAAAGGTPSYTYSWNTTPVKTTASVTGLSAGTYIVTVRDSNGCTNIASVTINQPAPVVASITSTGNINCYGGNNGMATATVSGGNAPYTYSWNTTPVQTSTTATNLTAGVHILTVTDANGCQDTAKATITQPALLDAAITATAHVKCNGDKNGSAAVSVSGGTSAYSYSWNTIPVRTTASVSGLATGTYTVTVTDSKGCIDTTTVNITEPAILNASATVAANVNCNGGADGRAIASATGGSAPYTYKWSTNPVQTNATASGLAAGTYNVTVTDNNGCTATSSVTVTEGAPMQISANATKSTCVKLADGEAIGNVAGGAGPYTFNWNTIPAQTTQNAAKMPAGTYIFTVTDSKGCTISDTVEVSNFPEMNLEVTPSRSLCENETVQLNASGALSYSWDNINSLSCGTCPNPIARPLGNTTYQVIGTDINNCKDTATVTIDVVTRKETTIGKDHEICEGEVAQLHAAGGTEYTWDPASTLDNNKSDNPKAKPDETTRYRVIIKQNDCFTDTLYQNVTVYPRPTIDLGPDIRSVPGEKIQLNARTTNTTSIAWSPDTWLSCTDCLAPIATVERTITYKAVVTNGPGCTASDEIKITVSCDGTVIFVPNTFTPNNDGLNDIFLPSVKGVNTLNRMTIYNRWGQVVFDARDIPANDIKYGWNGTLNNVDLKPDVFVYIISAYCTNGEPISVKGDISLIR